ncbi:16S rRNA (cytosine(967)-C(5))-methyltransferase RsmB [Streptococcus pluranimalium]|uniref:16S rRNA (cytosine(967)-C(5))-methyltransferase RsmB n=1 Tax=Streptococcus pluranimalium TaxID=82348 RepID=UPI0024154DA3|nr:16S rRNA (cytosine(967)-C(5))-methyltransferase RsmB [Streptococcus pluranimalium]WFM79461.1 16S rRNA (cytosine(967)-C(5))-methyltransferase RsmB [Streptococcus pluranimalium]
MANDWKKMARGGALIALEKVFHEEAYSNIALNSLLNNRHYDDRDKGLITEIVYGTVARKITLEWYLAHFIEDRDKLDPWVYDLLMLSAYQLIYLDKLPAHAVVNDAVTIAKNRGNNRGAEKLINAVLRKVTSVDLPNIDTIKRVNKRYSIKYSLPVWLVKKLIEQYGQERSEKIFASLFERNKASIRVTEPHRLEEFKENFQADYSSLSPVGLTKSSGHFASSLAFQNGAITIQDETSQLVAPTLDIKGPELILDACAAPGGKTVHMASYLSSGKITALDLYDHKLALIQENAKRLGLADKIETKQLDAREVAKAFPAESFDKILVDAPCSGIGLIRRKPDIKYNKDSLDFVSLQAVQLEILSSVCQTLRKGGIMTYSTCTIFREENQEVIKAFLASHPDFEQVALDHDKKDIVVDGCLLITPEQYHTDGFFIAKLRKKA